jgi:hypothetical protein
MTIDIGGMPVQVHTGSPEFAALLADRYGSFIHSASDGAVFKLDIDLIPPRTITDDEDEDVSVRMESGRWIIQRGDFRAECDPQTRQGWVRQSPNPYSIDGVLRILHSLLLAKEGGFLVHAASAIRNGRAFLFSGVSGAGKTTISRLAPPDVALLTDEISYVRRGAGGYAAYGTPFAGELARIGENLRAPLAAVYLLVQGAENRIEPVEPAEAVGALLRNILFFAHDEELVQLVFRAAFDFAAQVPIQRLVFLPDARVWELIV